MFALTLAQTLSASPHNKHTLLCFSLVMFRESCLPERPPDRCMTSPVCPPTERECSVSPVCRGLPVPAQRLAGVCRHPVRGFARWHRVRQHLLLHQPGGQDDFLSTVIFFNFLFILINDCSFLYLRHQLKASKEAGD